LKKPQNTCLCSESEAKDYHREAVELLRPVNNYLRLPELVALRLAVWKKLEEAYNSGIIKSLEQG
jgi:hypothetical protein